MVAAVTASGTHIHCIILPFPGHVYSLVLNRFIQCCVFVYPSTFVYIGILERERERVSE